MLPTVKPLLCSLLLFMSSTWQHKALKKLLTDVSDINFLKFYTTDGNTLGIGFCNVHLWHKNS